MLCPEYFVLTRGCMLLQKHDFAGMMLENCTLVRLRGPFELTYLPDQMDFTQGTVIERHDDRDPRTYLVQVRTRDLWHPSDPLLQHVLQLIPLP